jgi:hypothetical protein
MNNTAIAQSIDLGYNPRTWQRRCHSNKKRFSVEALHRRAGKTEYAIMELIDKALKFTLELGVFAYVAPFRNQAKVVTWSRLKAKLDILHQQGMVHFNESELAVTFKHNNAMIRLFGADNADAMRGLRLDGTVIDEVAQIKPEVWFEIIRPMLSDRNGWAIFIGTPKGMNLFSELYFQAENLDDWSASKYTVYDTEAIDPKEIEQVRKQMPSDAFAREYLCDFTASGDDQLISLSDAMLAGRRMYRETDFVDAPKIVGVDPARFGNDRTVIFRRQGLQAFNPIVLKGLDNMEVASRVAGVINSWTPDATFVDSGAGAGIIDRLHQLNYDVIEVAFGGKALNPDKYINRRSEMWFKLKHWVENKGSIPDETMLKKELATPIYWYDNKGRQVLEPKDDIKKRLHGGSPDLADALALTFAHDVQRSDVYISTIAESKEKSQREKRNEYDPFKIL